MNKLRNRQFMSIRRMIKSCTNQAQLDSCKELVLKYHNERGQDSTELMAIYMGKESELFPETFEDEILNEQHKKLSI